VGLKAFNRSLILLVLIVITSITLLEADSSGLTDDEIVRLKRGDILLNTIHSDKSGGAVRVTALFFSSAQAVWDVIGYCRNEFIYLRGLKFCEMLKGDQFQMTKHHRLRSNWYTPTLDFTFDANRDSGGYGEAHLVGGDLDVLEGQWKLVPFEGENSIVVTHEIRIQPKIPVPKWVIRRSLKNDLPGMLACIRGLAGASGSNGHIEGDLKRCPGEIPEASK
jgi:hypothetical protein